jgi:Plasmid pRiA4b ORF-3-like protein
MAKTAAPKKRAATGVLSLKVTLGGIKPPIWRRILMPGTRTLFDLHMAIQVTMGWMDSHLHAFDIGGRQYGDRATTDDVANEAHQTLNGLVKSGVSRFCYTYDFGDDWEHDVLIEKAPSANAARAYPACVAGKRNCPPEDCGGAWGYAELLAALADPAHPRHEEQREWIGEDFDPEAFSVPKADAILAAAFRRK